MDKYKRYFGVMVFIAAMLLVCFGAYLIINHMYTSYTSLKENQAQIASTLEQKKAAMDKIKAKIANLKQSVMLSQKKIYSPIEGKLGNDTLFFTLYKDLIEMVHSNSIKIDSIEYTYNPQGDPFVAQGAVYFVCDVNLKLVSNYINLGKLVQDIYQYPYYIRITNLEVYPYPKDKKILLTSMSVRLYAHTMPEELLDEESDAPQIIDGAQTPLPQ